MRGRAWTLIGLVVVSTALAGEAATDKLRGELPAVLAAARPNELVPVSVVLREQLSDTTIASLAGSRLKIAARLKSLADRTQHNLRVQLTAWQAKQQVARIRPLWLSNVVGVDATAAVVYELAARADVAWINYNPKRAVFLGSGGAGNDADAFDWGVVKMRAPEVWSDLGLTGAGVVVADIDSGSCYDHPDIKNRVWINAGEDLDHDRQVMDSTDINGVDDDGNGFVDDFIGWNFEVASNDPRDDVNGHGSHTTGTVAGDGTQGTKTGVAPGAQMMVVKVGLTLADEVDVWNGMQYAADNGANLITMSLGWQHAWNPDRVTWRRNSENTIAMGTIMIVAAGNEGAGNEPDNVRTPGDVPRVITIGATETNDAAASFSSRGPVSWTGIAPYNDHPYPPGLIKPDVSAPGVDTNSLNFCNGYALNSGTSMATPHVAGAAALMLEGDPFLTRDELAGILESTAIDLGPAGKDTTFGAGRVDAYAAAFEANAKLRYAAHRVDDSGTDRGNGDLSLDPGEIARLIVTLTNTDVSRTFTGISAYLISETPGVTVLDNRASYPDLGPLASAESIGAPFSLKIDAGCFTDARMRLDTYSADGRRSRSRFVVRVGSPQPTVLFADDGETALGWVVSGNATDGAWVRGVPVGTTSGGRPANPPQDAGPSSTRAWVTGNSGSTATDDDVDGGETILTSPKLDASSYATLGVIYSRWFYREGLPSSPPNRWYIVEASDDDGATWVNVENILAVANSWTAHSRPLDTLLSLTNAVRLRVRVNDTAPGDAVTEGGLDEVRISGDRIVCDAYTPPTLSLPAPVGNTLRVQRVGEHLRLVWTAPTPGAGQGPATRFAILGGTQVGVPLTVVGGATTSEWWEQLAVTNGKKLQLYVVASENSSGRAAGDTP